jgi:hypothetical protein
MPFEFLAKDAIMKVRYRCHGWPRIRSGKNPIPKLPIKEDVK